jgi:hypothetical protein
VIAVGADVTRVADTDVVVPVDGGRSIYRLALIVRSTSSRSTSRSTSSSRLR